MTNSHLHLIRTLFFKTLLAWSQLIEKHNKNTFDVTKFHRPGGLNYRYLFLTVRRLEVQDQGANLLGEKPLPDLQTVTLLLGSHTAKRGSTKLLYFLCVCAHSLSRVWLFATPWTVVCQAPLSMGFSRQEYWSRLPFPPPGDLPDPGIEPVSPALAGGFFTTEPPGKSSRFLL